MKVAAVIPTCRGVNLQRQNIPVSWHVVHDGERHTVAGYTSHDIIAPDPVQYGKKCDSIRSAGFLRAVQDGADIVCTTDDDCLLPIDWAAQHVEQLSWPVGVWSHTIETNYPVRGMPEANPRKIVAIHHGVWDGVPDLSGKQQLKLDTPLYRHMKGPETITPPFPQSAMNLSFIREVLPVMYQPAQGEGTPFDRYADIWGGVMAQRILTQFNYAFRNGGAVLYHSRESDPIKNIEKERPGDAVHDQFWMHIWRADITGKTLNDAYKQLGSHVKTFNYTGDYFKELGDKMVNWVDLCNEK